MAYYERDYYAEDQQPKSGITPIGVVGKTLAIGLGVIFFIMVGVESDLQLDRWVFDGKLLPHLVMQPNALIPYADGEVWPSAWQILTAPLIETNLISLILTAVFLCWLIGGMVEKSIGAKRFILLLIFAGVGTSIASALVDPLLAGERPIVVAGPGALSLCVFTVCALLAGDARTFFGLRFATVAWILIGISLIMTLSAFYGTDVGVVSSIGGSLAAIPMGFVAAKILSNRGIESFQGRKKTENVEDWKAYAKRFRDDLDESDETTAARRVKTEKRDRREAEERQRLDELLERIGRDGISSLSKAERAFLERMSKRKREESRT